MSTAIEVTCTGALVHFTAIRPDPAGRTEREHICQLTPDQADTLAGAIALRASACRSFSAASKAKRIAALRAEIDGLQRELDQMTTQEADGTNA